MSPPNDARPWTLRGRHAVVTGGSAGIGFEVCRRLLAAGASVTMLGRSQERGQAAVTRLLEDPALAHSTDPSATTTPAITWLGCDLASQASVATAVDQLTATLPRLDLLVNNAGGINLRRQTTTDGHERTFAINQLGPFRLTLGLLPLMLHGHPSRIVTLGSSAHYSGDLGGLPGESPDLMFEGSRYHHYRAYARSKLANVVWAEELARRLEGTEVASMSVHPGLVRTDFGRAAGGWMRWYFRAAGWRMRSAAEGADGVAWLCETEDAAGLAGRFWVDREAAVTARAARVPGIGPALWETCLRLCGLDVGEDPTALGTE